MSCYKEHRGPKRRGYDNDYTPDYPGAGGQREHFTPRPNWHKALSRSRQALNGLTPTRVSDLSLWRAGPMRSCPHEL